MPPEDTRKDTNDGFRDRNHRYSYLVACFNARRIVAGPHALITAKAHLERFTRPDPHQAHAWRLWSALLEQDPATIARRLTERSPEGDFVRETAPSFGAIPPRDRAILARQARTALLEPAA